MNRRRLVLLLLSALAMSQSLFLRASAADLGDAQWVWSPNHNKYEAPAGALYFRKVFELTDPESGTVEIACDNSYELFINGTSIGKGNAWEAIDKFDVSKQLKTGRNVIAVAGSNESRGAAGMVARLTAKERGKKVVIVASDSSWKSSPTLIEGWQALDFKDDKWEPARTFGKFGQTAPWGNKALAVASTKERFSPLPGFKVVEVVTPGGTGSLVAMAFTEQGDILASRESGPLLLVRDADHDGKLESVTPYSDKINNCQGILPLHGRVYAVANGPQGTCLYRLTDADSDGKADQVESLFKFRGGMGEHGPHAPVLGPDGMIYIMLGNHTFVEPAVSPDSPHHDIYEGDLITPKYEDANGHAVGIKAPCGTVVRTNTEGSVIELFCGGFRNAYDLGVNRDGDLFTFDSDMEWDVGLPWYRPTRVNHCIAGSESGSRSGWSVWPSYYPDSLPPTVDIGRGSPTGLEFYNHTRFPEKYRNALFMCDWSQGKILAVTMQPAGGTYEAKSETFLEGRPLNCSDIAVGPDGWLYFSVGGRGTQGSLFRIETDKPEADKPEAAKEAAPIKNAVQRAVHQPQLYSAWSRKLISEAKIAAADKWDGELVAIAQDAKALAADRARALDLLQMFGPAPKSALLVELSKAEEPLVRSRAAYLLGLHPGDSGGARLIALLNDSDATVRRIACESIVRAKIDVAAEKLIPLLGDKHHFVAWAASRAIQQRPVGEWRKAVLESPKFGVFTMGSVALFTMQPDRAAAELVLQGCGEWVGQELPGDEFLELLRIVQLAVYRGKLEGEDLPQLRSTLAGKYPHTDPRINRELVRLLVALQEPTLASRLVEQLKSDIEVPEKIHAAMYARFLQVGWTPELRSGLLKFFDDARKLEGGNSYRGYLTNAANDFIKTISASEQLDQLAKGAKTPGVTLGLVQALLQKPTPEQLAALRRLDKELEGDKSPPARELSKAILYVLARGDIKGLTFLVQIFESSPDRRGDIAQVVSTLVLGGQRHDEDWQLLIRSLAVAEGPTARNVLKALAKLPNRESRPEPQRQVILLGLKLQDQGGQDAVALLEQWTGKKLSVQTSETALADWQKWFRETYPGLPEPNLPVETAGNKWTYTQLLDFINSEKGSQGNLERGTAVFDKAQCVKCHRYGNRGEGVGPDLTNVSSRFQRKEVLESVLFPSQVISDQFASKTVITNDGRSFTGLVGPAGDDVVVLQSNAEKVKLAKSDIESIVPSKKSAMPEGLFNPLTLEEIADLFAYLAKPPSK